MQITALLLLIVLTSFWFSSLQHVSGIIERPTITASGYPPRITVTWKTITPQEENASLTYDVICCTCGLVNCHNAIDGLSDVFNSSVLQRIPWCNRSSSQPGLTFQCNVTGVKNCQRTSWQLKNKHFYAVIKVSNDLGANYSQYGFLNLFEFSKCTQPTGFTGVASARSASARRSVNLTWSNPLYMGNRTAHYLRFRVSYAAHANHCSNVSNQIQHIGRCNDRDLFSCAVGSSPDLDLLPYTRYTFYVACVSAWRSSNTQWGESAVFNIRTRKEAPSVHPTDVERLGSVLFGKNRNITVQWKAPSCSTEWGAVPKEFIIDYWPSNTSIALQSREEQRNSSLSGSLEVTNTSSRSAVIGYLHRYTSYLVTVRMCSTGGCGPASDAMYFKAEKEIPQPSQPTTFSDKPTDGSGMIIASEVGGIAVIVVVVVIFCCVVIRRSRYPSGVRAAPHLRGRVDDVRPQDFDITSKVSSDENITSYYDLGDHSRTSLLGL